jgi:hypothetical protein
MSTRSRVGLELADGSILSIYSHFDGYPEWAGRILQTHYNTREKVEELVDGGDVSCLWTDKDWKGKEWSDCKYKALTYAERGEDCPPRLDKNLGEYLQNNEEYGYVFTETEGWLCYDTCDWHETYLELQQIPSGALAV